MTCREASPSQSSQVLRRVHGGVFLQVVSDGKMPAHSTLLLRTTTRTHAISRVPFDGLSLREKVTVMR